MQAHIQKTFDVRCSRASLSRRLRGLGFTRTIIRRGFRSHDQSVPDLSQADLQRLMAAPSPAEVLMNFPRNAKKAKYAWLLDCHPDVWRKPRKKNRSDGHAAEEFTFHTDPTMVQILGADHGHSEQMLAASQNGVEHDLMPSPHPIPRGQHQSPSPALTRDKYVPSYISPHQQVRVDGDTLVRLRWKAFTARLSRTEYDQAGPVSGLGTRTDRA